MRKRITMGVVTAAVLATVTACGGGGIASSSAAGPTNAGAGSPAGSPPADAGSPAADGSPDAGSPPADGPGAGPGGSGNIVVACDAPTFGNQVEVDTFDVSSGQLTTATFSYQSEQFSTAYGEVTWNPTDDSGIEEGNGDPCQGWQWNPEFTSIMGTVSITNGNTVPASVSIADNTLTLMAPVKKSTGFASAPQNNILDAVFGPDGTVWWVEPAPGSTRSVMLHHGDRAQTVTFPSDVDVTNGVTIDFGAGGAWALNAVANDDGSEPVWATANGISTAQDMPLPALPSYGISASDLKKLLPQTQYYVYDGMYSKDRSQIAFFANLQGGPSQLFTVPASGGNPTQVTNESDYSGSDTDIVYFGPQ